jgi:hypothetical protein
VAVGSRLKRDPGYLSDHGFIWYLNHGCDSKAASQHGVFAAEQTAGKRHSTFNEQLAYLRSEEISETSNCDLRGELARETSETRNDVTTRPPQLISIRTQFQRFVRSMSSVVRPDSEACFIFRKRKVSSSDCLPSIERARDKRVDWKLRATSSSRRDTSDRYS